MRRLLPALVLALVTAGCHQGWPPPIGQPPPTTTTAPPATTTTAAPATTTTATPTTTAVPPPGAFYANAFDTAADLSRIRIVSDPAGAATGSGVNFNGDHDLSCGAATTYRPLNENGGMDNVYFCNQHFMTAMNTTGYRTFAFTPTSGGNVIVFPATANKVCWDQQTTALGGRKWPELAVVSEARFNANGGALVYQNPVFAANASASAVQLAGDDFLFFGIQTQFFKGQQATFQDFFTGRYDGSLTDKMSRYPRCIIDNGDGTVTRTEVRPAGTPNAPLLSVTGPGAFPAGPRVVIFMDVTYDADKEQAPGSRIEEPYTMHWDNLFVGAR